MTKGLVHGRAEVRTRMSVRRLEDSYALSVFRAWMSLRLKTSGTASRLDVQMMRPASGEAVRRGRRKWLRR